MRDRSMQSGTKLAREIQLTDWSTGNKKLSNRSSGVEIPRDICTRFGRYLYSTRCSWVTKGETPRRPTKSEVCQAIETLTQQIVEQRINSKV